VGHKSVAAALPSCSLNRSTHISTHVVGRCSPCSVLSWPQPYLSSDASSMAAGWCLMETANGKLLLTAELLTTPVRRLLHSAEAEITSWDIQELRGSGNPATEGVYRVHGRAAVSTGVTAWSLVLKVIQAREGCTGPVSPGFWRREPVVHQSGLLRTLPSGV